MANLAQILKAEIARLARKEATTVVQSTRKAASQHRHEIGSLKRRIVELQKEVARLTKQEARQATRPPSSSDAEGRRFSAKSVKSQRARLGLSRREFGLLVGRSQQAIYLWESGRGRPDDDGLAALVAIRMMGKREAWKRLDAMGE